jgi:predicted ATP-grasp superfamily ATP-dependent carboligase
MPNNNIIVIGGGNHHNALGVIRALGERGYRVTLITIDGVSTHYISSSKYVTDFHALANIKELAAYLLYRQPAADGSKEIVISCADAVTEHLNLYRNRLANRYILPGVPDEGEMVRLMDKVTMINMVAQHGISAPTTWQLPEDYDKVTFPCITKAHVSSHGGKSDIVICQNEVEFNEFISGNNDSIFAQSYINKKEEVQFIGCSINDGEEVIIPGMSKVLRSQPNTNTGFLEYGPIDPFYTKVVENAKAYIRSCRYSGLFSFEILRDHDDKVWFLEINFRNDGNAWCVTKSGVNLPVIWVKSCLNQDYTQELATPKKITMMPEFQDFKLVLQRKVGLKQWLKDVRRTDYFMEYDAKDKAPFWRFIWNKVI